MKQLLLTLFIGYSFISFAQEKQPNKYDINYAMASVVNPSYDQGLEKLRKDIVNNVDLTKIEGVNKATATVSCRISSKGKLTDIKVVEPIGYGIDKQIVEQLKSKQFTPLKQDGMATSCAVIIDIPIK